MIKKLALAVLAIVVLGVSFLSWVYQGAISRVPTEERVVVLTFDDGPNPPHTAALLSLLESRGVTATFFPKARNVEAYPDDARALVAAGHEVGNHSYAHLAMGSLDKTSMLSEIERANRVLRDIMGIEPRFFRPPFGVQSVGVRRALQDLNMISILASDHGSDWELTDAQSIAAAVLEGIEPGAIILLHDGHGDVEDPMSQHSRAPSVEATGIIIDTLQARGYRFATLGEFL